MTLSFNGVKCTVKHLEVLDSRRPLRGETKDQFIELPYHHGSILIPDPTFRDIEIEVDFLFEKPKGQGFYVACRNMVAWLYSPDWKPLIFDDDPTAIYKAKVINTIDVERIARYGTFTVKFRCSPLGV